MNTEDKKYVQNIGLIFLIVSMIVTIIGVACIEAKYDSMKSGTEWQCVEWEGSDNLTCSFVVCNGQSCVGEDCRPQRVCVKEGLFRNVTK